MEPLLERVIVLLHLAGGRHQTFDDGAETFAVLGIAKLVGRVGQAFGVGAGRANGSVHHCHDLVDLVHHARADAVDLVAEAGGGNVGGVDLFEIGVGQRAVLRQRLIDHLVERRIVAGRVGVPDFVIARVSWLPQRLDLTQRNFRERQRTFIFVGLPAHPAATPLAGRVRDLPHKFHPRPYSARIKRGVNRGYCDSK